jgi:hypothetical protein
MTRPRALLATALAILSLSATNDNTRGDHWLNLATSSALVHNGTPRLDGFADSLLARPDTPRWTVEVTGNHIYNRYPIGLSLFALPAVAVAEVVGWDMRNRDDDRRVQRLLAAMIVAVSFLLLDRIAAVFLAPGPARLAAFATVTGTSLISTLATGFWSHGPFVLLSTGALAILVARQSAIGSADALVCGLLLGAAWTCRPTAVVPVVACLMYVSFVRWQSAPSLLLGTGGVVLLAMAYWLQQTGSALPAYYRPATWPGGRDPLIGLLANTLSPGRGWFIFSPILLIACLGWLFKDVRRQPLFLLAWVWTIGIMAMVARLTEWWGGWSYGPRLLTDALPAAFLAGVITLNHPSVRASLRKSRSVRVSLAAAAVYSLAVHSAQGLFNGATWAWNSDPNVNEAPIAKVFDWRNPQFLATPRRLNEATARLERRRVDNGGYR